MLEGYLELSGGTDGPVEEFEEWLEKNVIGLIKRNVLTWFGHYGEDREQAGD